MASLRGFFAGHDFQGVLKTPKWVMMMLCGFLYLKSVSDQAKIDFTKSINDITRN